MKEIDDMVANNWEQLSELLDEKIGVRYDADKADQAKAKTAKSALMKKWRSCSMTLQLSE